MLGLFKKKMTPAEFGNATLYYAFDFVSSDAGRSLARRFDESDGSRGWSHFLEGKGIAISTQKFHFQLYAHCAIQAACTRFDEDTRRAITRGAVENYYSVTPDGYDFSTTYSTLEAAYFGQHKFNTRIDSLVNSDAQLPFLQNTNVGVINAKYLIDSFIIPNMTNSNSFVEEFGSYSLDVSVSVTVVYRALNYLFKSFNIF